MAMSLGDMVAGRPVDRTATLAYKKRMLDEVRAHQLRELRESAGLTDVDVAGILRVTRDQVLRLENGDIDHTEIGTLRRYVEAVGGHLHIEVAADNRRVRIGS